MSYTCIKCGQPTDEDLDSWTMIHDTCLEIAVRAIDDRNARLTAGDPTVANMNAEERENVLQVRQKQREASL